MCPVLCIVESSCMYDMSFDTSSLSIQVHLHTLTQMWRPADKCAFLRSYLRSSHFNMISPHPPISNTQTPKYQTHRFDIHVFLLRGESTAINANIRLVRCFIVMLPSARIDRNGCPIHIMHRRSISNGPRIGAAANISSL